MLLFAGVAACLLALLSPVSNTVHADDAKDTHAETEDFQDLVFLGDHGPVILRLHILIDGKAFSAMWDEAIRSLFQFLDRNGDGVLSKEEAERAPKVQRLAQQARAGFFSPAPGGTASMSDLDTDPEDGKVTLDELRKYYRQYDFGALELTFAPVQDFASVALTDALFTHLDRNKDGKLSKEELAAAPSVLQILDVDDDELISIQELLPELGTGMYGQVAVGRGQAGAGADIGAMALLSRTDAANRLAVAQQMLRRYDRDKNQKLSRSEIGLEKAVFDKLDTNHDGELEVTELMRLLRRLPDCEMIFRLGKAGREPRAAVYHPNGQPRALNFEVQPTGNGALVLSAGGAQVKLLADPRILPDYNLGSRGNYLQLFRNADSGQKGYLLMKDVERPQFQQLKLLFSFADRDGDGKLTEKELGVYLDLQAKLAVGFTSLAVTDQGRGLFEALDANHDSRLSVRELRTAWSRLAAWDRNGDGCIDKTEIPGQFLITVSRGRFQFAGRPGYGGQGMFPTLVPTRGPLWFRKMDRNGDGDVSRREFLGKPEDFDKIDSDHDGLISVEEAEKADAWYRQQAAKK
ncbi:MAG TPA: EF-hand domain-containing protein [Gemmataceae bacterium]|nr:EF-hand domain-containing protein [Gemmataceae bacterium]